MGLLPGLSGGPPPTRPVSTLSGTVAAAVVFPGGGNRALWGRASR